MQYKPLVWVPYPLLIPCASLAYPLLFTPSVSKGYLVIISRPCKGIFG